MKSKDAQHLSYGDYDLTLIGLRVNEQGAFLRYEISGLGVDEPRAAPELFVPVMGGSAVVKEPGDAVE